MELQVCSVGSDLFFLGSRLGDSLLIQVTDPRTTDQARQPSLASAPAGAADDAPTIESAKTAPSADDELDELDALLLQSANAELHRPAAASPFQLQYTVCDSLLNVGPVADLAVGEPTRPPSSTSAAAAAADNRRLLEVITCSGHDKNGALCVLQRAVQPAVISAFTLAGARDAFAVRGASSHLAAAVAATSEQLYGPAPTSAEAHHRFLLISQDAATLVLECGEELTQLPTTDFYTAGPTIFAGSVCNDEFIVQVYSTGVRLLTGGTWLCLGPGRVARSALMDWGATCGGAHRLPCSRKQRAGAHARRAGHRGDLQPGRDLPAAATHHGRPHRRSD